jgi:hypothetical protein
VKLQPVRSSEIAGRPQWEYRLVTVTYSILLTDTVSESLLSFSVVYAPYNAEA